ncbi:hypothetical protein TWF696_007968 [Orbilia brochopaga]|uniref:Amidohydrolase-related domain-containing protein n=1 Tax=Orbilia brochopaga TaxID=3140254 RepID=A0AAV9UMH6_9PEZI
MDDDRPSPPIIDSHIHLFRLSDLPSFNWSKPTFPINGACEVSDYIRAIEPAPTSFKGFIFIETDRKWQDPASASTADELTAWQNVREEYRYVLQNATSPSIPVETRNLVRGIVPWAPVHQGRDAMIRHQKHLDGIDAECGLGSGHGLLVGYRYTLQGQPPGTASTLEFWEGLKYICDVGRVFEVAVDVNREGLSQLEDIIEGIVRAPGLKVVLNHLCKPPLGSRPKGGMNRWMELMTELAGFPGVVVKLSGCFNELPEDYKAADEQSLRNDVAYMAMEYVRPIFQLFGPRRIIWASDWPMCGIGHEQALGQQAGAWHDWLKISKVLVDQLQTEDGIDGSPEDWENIWGANAVRVYSLVDRDE